MESVADAEIVFEAAKEDVMVDKIKGHRAVQKTEEEWSVVIKGDKEVIEDEYDGGLSVVKGYGCRVPLDPEIVYHSPHSPYGH